jgi:hypothetical protein
MKGLFLSTSGPVAVTQVRPVSRSEALEIVMQKGRDWRQEADFKDQPPVNNLGATDLLEISYASDIKEDVYGVFFVGHSHAGKKKSQDFQKEDIVTIFFDKKDKPEFVYNQSTHFLGPCFNYRDATITPDRGVEVRLKSHKKMRQMVDAVNMLTDQGHFADKGPNARIKSEGVAYSYERFRTLKDLFTRDIKWWVIGGCVLIYLILTLFSYLVGGNQDTSVAKAQPTPQLRQFKNLDALSNEQLRREIGTLTFSYEKSPLNYSDLKIFDEYDLILLVGSSQKLNKRYSYDVVADKQRIYGSYEQFSDRIRSLKKHLNNSPDTNIVLYFSPAVSKSNRHYQIKKLMKLPYNSSSDRIVKGMLSDKKLTYEEAKGL